MELDHSKNIKRIMANIKCPFNFDCYKLGLKPICRMIGVDEDFVKIEREGGNGCGYLQLKKKEHYCMCPLYAYLAKNLLIPHEWKS